MKSLGAAAAALTLSLQPPKPISMAARVELVYRQWRQHVMNNAIDLFSRYTIDYATVTPAERALLEKYAPWQLIPWTRAAKARTYARQAERR